jgi:hypothetical protein
MNLAAVQAGSVANGTVARLMLATQQLKRWRLWLCVCC